MFVIRISCPDYPVESVRVSYYNGFMGYHRDCAKVYASYGKAVNACKHAIYGIGTYMYRESDTGPSIHFETEIEIINADEN